MSAFTAAYAAARTARAAAATALATAVTHATPMEAELAELMQARRPEQFAAYLVKVAEIEATLPGLRATLEAARDAEHALSLDACDRCQGTGDYAGRTRHFKAGRPVCFSCHGDGRHAQARRAA